MDFWMGMIVGNTLFGARGEGRRFFVGGWKAGLFRGLERWGRGSRGEGGCGGVVCGAGRGGGRGRAVTRRRR